MTAFLDFVDGLSNAQFGALYVIVVVATIAAIAELEHYLKGRAARRRVRNFPADHPGRTQLASGAPHSARRNDHGAALPDQRRSQGLVHNERARRR